ncbi:uncharacterized protein TRAVEDRAFT_54659 [Trametes versicolor FP-101664 SS1]|uniref:Uncharacterized protein n=1 Tax=Trametes versicolor (strain FP-101664) TaxID=717944 RepID=R7S693_TRAVS|nr:uncharacterized protein TRAVEDRAFT_54659 [Trametes versicolor FP-101664 SS1]EIW51326.1 hypothetical protein TRAVEDRAFT_54659 [Trametes versicolor FP-101664 SS1]
MSPTNSTAFPLSAAHARALSPAIAALSLTSSPAATDEDRERVATSIRRHAYEKAVTVTDLCHTIPNNYRDALSADVHWTAEITEKLVAARSSLRKLESALADGKTPPHLLMKVPELQACKEFRTDGTLASYDNEVRASVAAGQKAVMEAAISAKKAEISFLEGRIDPKFIFERYKDSVAKRWADVRARSKVPVTSYRNAEGKPCTIEHAAGVHVDKWEVDPSVLSEFNYLISDLYPIARRCITIVEMRDFAMQAKIEKKKATEKSADVEMADATKPGPSIQSLVDKAVAGRVKPLEGKLNKLSVKGGKTLNKNLVVRKTVAKASTKKSTGPKPGPSKKTTPKPSGGKDPKGKRKAGTYSAALAPFPTPY